MSNEKEEQGAQVLDLATLLAPEETVDEKEKTEKEFEDALLGKSKPKDYLGLEEEEEEEKTPPIISELLKDEEEEEIFESKTDYKELLISIFDTEIPTVIQQNEAGEEVEVGIEDLNITEELFREIIQSRIADLKSEATEGKIPVDSISDFMKSLIEIEKNGGDISELLQARQVYIEPLDKLDLTTDEGLKQAIVLRDRALGMDEAKIARLIRSYELDGVLEEEGQKAESELRQAMNVKIEKTKEEALKKKDEFETFLKTYKKNIRESLDTYELTDTAKNKIATIAAKVDNGGFGTDKYYFEKQRDPKEAADLALFLIDKELYNKQITTKKVQETKLKTSVKLGTIRKPTESANLTTKTHASGEFIDLSQS